MPFFGEDVGTHCCLTGFASKDSNGWQCACSSQTTSCHNAGGIQVEQVAISFRHFRAAPKHQWVAWFSNVFYMREPQNHVLFFFFGGGAVSNVFAIVLRRIQVGPKNVSPSFFTAKSQAFPYMSYYSYIAYFDVVGPQNNQDGPHVLYLPDCKALRQRKAA